MSEVAAVKPEVELEELLSRMFSAHPWHGVPAGPQAPELCNVFIEIVPTESVKYELDKASGHLLIDRPQRYSSTSPTLYGFIPRTYCGSEIAKRCSRSTGYTGIRGDGDPLDVCVLTEKTVVHGNLLLRAIPIGGLRMIDANEADDKIVAVLEDDVGYGEIRELSQLPAGLIDRLRHYFLSYKQLPGEAPRRVEIAEVYNAAEANAVVQASMQDYLETYGDPAERLPTLRRLLAAGPPPAPAPAAPVVTAAPAKAGKKAAPKPAAAKKKPVAGKRPPKKR